MDATVKDATAAPLGVNRSSGSLVMLPTIVRLMSPWALEYRLERSDGFDVSAGPYGCAPTPEKE